MKALFFIIPLASSLLAQDVILDKTTSLLWQDSSDNKELSVTFFEAQEYCEKLEIKQYKDFRLPTLFELQSIIDYNRYKPAIIDGFIHIESETYWSTTSFADDAAEVWTINFKKGERTVKAKHYSRNFRCVTKVK